jgi:hypothetical protein
MALHKPKQLYVLGKLRFSSIKPMKMIEIWLKITFIFINGHDFQSGIKIGRISRQFALYIKAVCFTSHAYRYSIVYMCKYWLYEQNGRSKFFNLDSVWVTLEYWLFFLNCYEWCKFPFTRWSVDIILSKENLSTGAGLLVSARDSTRYPLKMVIGTS